MIKHPPDTPIPDRLRGEFVLIRRADLPDDHMHKEHRVFGYRIEHIQRGEDPYPLEWWAEI